MKKRAKATYSTGRRGRHDETLHRSAGNARQLSRSAAAQVQLIVWCRDCRHKVELDPAEQVARYGADLPVRDWVKRLVCSQCGSRSIDFVLTGTRR